MPPTMREEKRSPIKLKPLPLPGDSLRDYLDNTVSERVLAWSSAIAFGWLWAYFEWYHQMFSSRPQPWIATAMAAVITPLGIVKLRRIRQEVQNIHKGIQGERAVSQLLDELRADGYRVFNDIPQEDCNVDHVLIGPGGVFVIETKAPSKTATSKVEYDGRRILVDGWEPDRDPIAQVKACSDGIQRILRTGTGQRVKIRPVVIYPGWWVEKQPRGVDVWVLNDTAFMDFVANQWIILSEEEVTLLASALETHVRSRLSAKV